MESTTMPSDRKERLSWYLYDFANTSFTVLMVTALYPLFFKAIATAYFGDANVADALWGFAGTATMLVVAAIAPVLGAIADYSGAKKKFLIFFTALCVFFNSLIFFIPVSVPMIFGIPVWIIAWVFFVIANIGFEGALPFYDAWLPEISTEDTIARVGGFGYAAGYVGAFFTVLIALISVLNFGDMSTIPYLLGAIFFFVFAIPAIRGLKNRPALARPEEEGMSMISIGFNRLKVTFREMKKYQGLPRFLASYFIFSDAITTVIVFAAIYGAAVYAFTSTDILIFFLVTQLSAIPGAFIFGYIGDYIGTKKTLIITLFLWIFVLLLGVLGSEPIVFWILGMIAGVGMGSAQSTARSMYGQYIPEEKRTEMFGLYAFTGRFVAIFGPSVYGGVLLVASSYAIDNALA
ncbi:MAG: MFS transporter, partial [Candidatus Thorarchaeota archaeon]